MPSSRQPARGRLALGGVLALLWSIHLAATAAHGFALPDSVRHLVGASAETAFTRPHAHLTAPFFHDGIPHLLYNTLLFGLALPYVVRAHGRVALVVASFASPLVGVLVDALLILPLAGAGSAVAIAAAPARLVGASIVAFALLGMAIVALAGRIGRARSVWLLGALVLYEGLLAATGTTRPFVWAYHLGGLFLGMTATSSLPRAPARSRL